ncbi:hypothetical protein C8F04DRAFT_1252040 [Mycena alexandri]|uniref:C2 domain-containing protein n=1 Tax=Mycena alexandri TaxID=1745969 RepID=A0AAD6XAE4_9AGAR|nr:hypothetical protein C8F04DRAFT_1252040 [Mycena alexandri]
MSDFSALKFLMIKSQPRAVGASFEATGALKVIIQSAHIDGADVWWQRPPSPFVSIRVNDTRTTTDMQAETYDPSWIRQTFFLLVKSPMETVQLKVYDHHEYRKHGLLGATSFDMNRLSANGMALDAQLPLLKEKKRKGDLLCSLFYYPISISPEKETGVGIVRLIVHRAEDLLPSDGSSRNLNIKPKAKIRLDWDGPTIHATPRRRILENRSAVWESQHEFLCFDKCACVVYVDVSDPALGHVSLSLPDLIEATTTKRGPWPLSGSASGKLFASAEWRPLNLEANT